MPSLNADGRLHRGRRVSIAAVAAYYYARPRPYDQPRQHPSFVSENKGHHLDAPDEVVGWEVQMHEIARDMKAELDTKMRAVAGVR